KRLLRHFQGLRLGIRIGVAGAMTLAIVSVFWLINRGPSGLAEEAILLPALYLAMMQGKVFSSSWVTLVECLGFIEQVFDFLNQSFENNIQIPSPIPFLVSDTAEETQLLVGGALRRYHAQHSYRVSDAAEETQLLVGGSLQQYYAQHNYEVSGI